MVNDRIYVYDNSKIPQVEHIKYIFKCDRWSHTEFQSYGKNTKYFETRDKKWCFLIHKEPFESIRKATDEECDEYYIAESKFNRQKYYFVSYWFGTNPSNDVIDYHPLEFQMLSHDDCILISWNEISMDDYMEYKDKF